MKMHRTVGLIYGYSPRNAGDFAITLGAIDVLREFEVHVKLFSRYCKENKDYYDALELIRQRYGEDVEVFESPFNLDRKDNLLRTIKSYLNGAMSVVGIKRNKAFRKELLECDEVIFNGGNLFRCNSWIDYARLKALMYPLKIVKGKRPYLVFPQSASTINRIGKKELLPVLQNAEVVFIRERESFDYLSKFFDSKRMLQTVDLAFFIDKNKLPDMIKYKGYIAITLRYHTVGDIRELSGEEIKKVYQTMVEIIKANSDENFVVVVQCEKDYALSKQLSDEFGLDIVVLNDPIELLALYKNVKMLIGMRLHSIILALSVGTPCFGLFYKQWGLKNPGMMNFFGMPYRFLDVESDRDNDIEDVRNVLKHLVELRTKTLLMIGNEKDNLMRNIANFIQ